MDSFKEEKAILIGGGAVISDHEILDQQQLSVGSRPFPYPALNRVSRVLSSPRLPPVLHGNKSLRLGIRAFSMEDTMRKITDELSFTFDPTQKYRGGSRYQDTLSCQFLSSLQAPRDVRLRNYADLRVRLKALSPEIHVLEAGRQRLVPTMIRAPILVPPEKRSRIIQDLNQVGSEASPNVL